MSETTSPRSRLNVALLLLQAGVPLSLLVDLTSQKGPDSSLISVQERLPEPLPLIPIAPDPAGARSHLADLAHEPA